jgi:hypothetical protein
MSTINPSANDQVTPSPSSYSEPIKNQEPEQPASSSKKNTMAKVALVTIGVLAIAAPSIYYSSFYKNLPQVIFKVNLQPTPEVNPQPLAEETSSWITGPNVIRVLVVFYFLFFGAQQLSQKNVEDPK